jgi:hypothetical protein
VAFAVALLLGVLGAAAAGLGSAPVPAQADRALSGQRQQTLEGMLTCSRCEAKHSPVMGKSAADCVRTCAHLGAAFTLLDGDKTYRLQGDTNRFKQLAARRVRVVGVIQGNTIQVASIAPSE